MDPHPIITWVAPIVAALATCAGQLALNQSFKRADEKRDNARAETQAKRDAEAEWRGRIDRRLDKIEEKQNRSIASQAAQTRSDIVHKCHRYLDDLGKASIEEKQALHDEHVQYSQFCEDLGIDNNFIDNLVSRVMQLPERDM